MESGIYMLLWKESGYFYYGQSIDLKSRKMHHLAAMRNDRHSNVFIQRLYKKHGEPEFIIVEKCQHEFLDEKEQFYINENINKKQCCNISPTASSVKGTKRSVETRDKIRQSKIGKKHSDEYKEGCRQRMFKRYANGYKVKPMNGRLNGFYRKKHDVITRLIMSEKKKGMYNGGKNPKAKLILNTETGIFYDTIKEAAASQTKYKESTINGKINNTEINNTPFIKA